MKHCVGLPSDTTVELNGKEEEKPLHRCVPLRGAEGMVHRLWVDDSGVEGVEVHEALRQKHPVEAAAETAIRAEGLSPTAARELTLRFGRLRLKKAYSDGDGGSASSARPQPSSSQA